MKEEKWMIGNLIRKIRERQKITQEELCSGLCSDSTMNRIENGERDMDIALAVRIFQRLGYNPDKFELYGNQKEYQRYEKVQEIRRCRKKGELERLEQLLQCYARETEEITNIKQQIIFSNQGFLAIQREDYERGIAFLEKAILLTVPDWKESCMEKALGEDELEILDMLADGYEVAGDRKKAFQMRIFLLRYLERRGDRKEQTPKLYTGVICKLVPYLLEREQYRDGYQLCEQGLEVISKVNQLTFWPEILFWRGKSLEAMRKSGDESVGLEAIVGSFQRAYYIFRLIKNLEMAEKTKECLREYKWEFIRSEK